jgi:hypothetical protein
MRDVSDIFSPAGEDGSREKAFFGSSAAELRESTCRWCIHTKEFHSGAPGCRLFTPESARQDLTQMELILPEYGRRCAFFEPRAEENRKGIIEGCPDSPDFGEAVRPEVEETVTVRRRIAYPLHEGAQKQIRAALLKHLDHGYTIMSVELMRTSERCEPGRKRVAEASVTIFVKNP